MYNRLLSVFLVITIFFSMSGCKIIRTPGIADNSSVSSVPTAAEERKERVVHEATEYLKENYPDDEFTYVSGRSPDWAYPYYELAFTTKKYGDQEFIVYGVYPNGESTDVEIPYFPEVNTEQEFEYYDTYYQYYMKEDAEKYFTDLGNEYIGNIESCNVFFSVSAFFAEELDKSKSFEENLLGHEVTVHFGLTTSYDINETLDGTRAMANLFSENEIEVGFYIVHISIDGTVQREPIRYYIHDGKVEEISNE